MQQQQTRLSLWCERLIEAGWLLALSLIPIYFNLLSSRHFEPDKATTLRAIVLVMATLVVIRMLERIAQTSNTPVADSAPPGEPQSSNPLGGAWAYLSSIPLAIPVLFYVVVFIIATIGSVVPGISLWGSYQRLQGTYTNLSYIGLFVIVLSTLRRRDQLERIITITLLTAVAVSMYGVIQHMQQDPLPWKSDNLAERVASTMGNAIFVAAYLILVVPLALYRFINSINEARHTHASRASNPVIDLLWALAYTVMVLGTLASILAAITFGAAVQSPNFTFWWVFPGVVAAATGLWVIPSLRIDSESEQRVPLWPGGIFFAHAIFWSISFTSGQENLQIIPDRVTLGLTWWVWLLISVVAITAFYILALTLPRRAGPASPLTMWLRVAGTLAITGLILLATVYTQSRGPLLGLAAGLFTFFFLLLWQSMRRARELGATRTARAMGIALWGWGGLTMLGLAFLLVFNLSDDPFFNRLREQPYIGRFGSLLETRYGTGRVRFLIWNGDEHAGGARALITADPVRTVVGWGPESMFVAFNPFYPPALAEVESRGASPDRSHQAILDEMVTKGLLGLISFFFLLISFFALGWRLMRQSNAWHWQVFFIACMSIIVSHLVEGLTGIPIVSTLMMFWAAMAMTVSGGMLAGHYTIGSVPRRAQTVTDESQSEAAEPEGETTTPNTSTTTTDESKPAPPSTGKSSKKKGKQAKAARASGRSSGRGTTASTRGTASPMHSGASRIGSRGAARKSANPAAIALYAVLIALTLGAAWQLNTRTVYADMLFHMGQNLSDKPNANSNDHIYALNYYLRAVRNNRNEDFYYLNLGRSLMQIAAAQRQSNSAIGVAQPENEESEQQRAEQVDQMVKELLLLPDVQAVANFAQTKSALELMAYAEAVLERARELNPLNKDHYANLGRINNFTYSWTGEATHLRDAVAWYARANEVAPQDVLLLNESARIVLSLGRLTDDAGDSEQAEQHYAHAEYLLERAQTLEEDYTEYLGPLAELRNIQGDKVAATELYARQVEVDPQALDESLDDTITWLSDSPELLRKLSSAYREQAQATQEAPLSKNPNIVAKYQGIDPARLYNIAGRLAVEANDWDMASQSYVEAVELKPDNLEYRLNYTMSLSDTQSYNEALAQAQEGLSLAENQADSEKVAQFDRLISIFEDRAAGGQ